MAIEQGSTGEVVRFPVEKRRSPLLIEVEGVLRTRWAAVLEEPIPGEFLAALSRLERLEREQWAGQNATERSFHGRQLGALRQDESRRA